MGGDGYDTPLLVQIAGQGAENVYFTTHSLMDAQLGSEPVKGFMKRTRRSTRRRRRMRLRGWGTTR